MDVYTRGVKKFDFCILGYFCFSVFAKKKENFPKIFELKNFNLTMKIFRFLLTFIFVKNYFCYSPGIYNLKRISLEVKNHLKHLSFIRTIRHLDEGVRCALQEQVVFEVQIVD